MEPIDEIGLLSLWNGAMGDEFPLDGRLLSQQLALDTDPRRCFAYRDDSGRLVAAALAKMAARPGPSGAPPARGYLSFIVVDRSLRRRGIGSRLLAAAEDWLAGLGAEGVRLGQDHYHFFPGLPVGAAFEPAVAFAAARGFRPEGDECDLIADLRETRVDAALATPPAGYEYRYYRRSDDAALESFAARCFPGRWAAELREAIAAGMRPADLVLAVENAGDERLRVVQLNVPEDIPGGFHGLHAEIFSTNGPMRAWSEIPGDCDFGGDFPPVGNLAGYLKAVLGSDGVNPAHRISVAFGDQQIRENRLVGHVQRKTVSIPAAFSANAAA